MNLKELKKKVSALVREDEVHQSSDLGGIAYLFSLSRENYSKLFSAVAVLVLSVACLMVSVRLLGWLFEDLASDRTLVWQYAVAFLAFEVLAVFFALRWLDFYVVHDDIYYFRCAQKIIQKADTPASNIFRSPTVGTHGGSYNQRR